MWLEGLVTTLVVGVAIAEQHILLDSTKESMLDWTKYPHGPTAPTPGWVEESFTNFEKGINWSSYVVCDVGYPNVNNWLWTPYIERGEANRIHIEIKFSLRNCDLFPGTALQCKETFSLLFYEFDAATREPPPWETDSYTLIDRITADEGRYTNNNEVIINTATRAVDISKKGVYFAFRDQGACLSLLAIKVYFKSCPEITKSFAFYPETPTGKTEASIDKISGQCVANAVQLSEKLFSFCKSDGTWLYNQGGCQCMAGYESDRIGGPSLACQECPIGKFKSSPGDTYCQICPPHSEALLSGSVECRCNKAYYRSNDDDRAAACTRPPSAPRNLSLSSLGHNKITLSWKAPRDEGSRQDTVYRVNCDMCGHTILFAPSTPTFAQTFVTISGLSPLTSYRFIVSAQNGVSSLVHGLPPKSADITVYTHTQTSNPSSVTALFIKNVKPTSIMVGWQPLADPYGEIEMYEVKYFMKSDRHNSQVTENSTLITIREELEVIGLAEDTEYGFQVRAKTSEGWGKLTPLVYCVTATGGAGAAAQQPSDNTRRTTLLARLQGMKEQNAEGRLEAQSMNEVLLDFMISVIDTKEEIAVLIERVQELENDMERVKKFVDVDEIATDYAVTVGNLPKVPNKSDDVLAGELVSALNINLGRHNVEKVLRIGEQKNPNGSLKYPGKLLIELDNKANKIACLKENAKNNLKSSDQFKDAFLSQALSRAQITERNNTKELMRAAGLNNHRLNGLGRIVPNDPKRGGFGDGRGRNDGGKGGGRGRGGPGGPRGGQRGQYY